jgi:hypothetical protein
MNQYPHALPLRHSHGEQRSYALRSAEMPKHKGAAFSILAETFVFLVFMLMLFAWWIATP